MRSLLRKLTVPWLLTLSVFVSSLFLFGCGGGGYGGGGGGGGAAYTGSIALTVSGLPNGSNAAITVTGPSNYSQAVVASITLSALRPGTYTVTAASVMVGNTNYVPAPASQTVTVGSGSDGYGMGSNVSASVTYAVGAGKVEGAISKLDNFTVAGNSYDLGDASITVNDQAAQAADLRAGMVVKMQVRTMDDGSLRADMVSYNADLNGPVSHVDLDRNRLLVMGKQITITAATVFDDRVGNATDLSQLNVGNVVEISGYTAADGSLLAQRIERKNFQADSRNVVFVKGVVTDIDRNTDNFRLANLAVNYGNATLRHLTGDDMAKGQHVYVRGQLDGNGVLQATRVIDDASNLQLDRDKAAAIQGLVTAVADGSFTLNGYTVQLSDATSFAKVDVGQLQINAKISVHGLIAADGSVLAERVEFE